MFNAADFRWTYGVVIAAGMLLGTMAAASAQNAVPALNGDDRVLGKADAPITIFEYASLTCPHCAAFEADTFPLVKEEWLDTGKAKLVFRDFPLDKLALSAATITQCVPPERYFAAIQAIFKDQSNWAQMSDPAQALQRVADLDGLSKQQADACLSDERHTDFVVGERYTASTQYGVDSTPTFFINGQKTVGEMSYPAFGALLQTAAAKR